MGRQGDQYIEQAIWLAHNYEWLTPEFVRDQLDVTIHRARRLMKDLELLELIDSEGNCIGSGTTEDASGEIFEEELPGEQTTDPAEPEYDFLPDSDQVEPPSEEEEEEEEEEEDEEEEYPEGPEDEEDVEVYDEHAPDQDEPPQTLLRRLGSTLVDGLIYGVPWVLSAVAYGCGRAFVGLTDWLTGGPLGWFILLCIGLAALPVLLATGPFALVLAGAYYVLYRITRWLVGENTPGWEGSGGGYSGGGSYRPRRQRKSRSRRKGTPKRRKKKHHSTSTTTRMTKRGVSTTTRVRYGKNTTTSTVSSRGIRTTRNLKKVGGGSYSWSSSTGGGKPKKQKRQPKSPKR